MNLIWFTICNTVFVFPVQSPTYHLTIHFLTTKLIVQLLKTEFVQMLFTLFIVVSGIEIEGKISSDNSKSKFGQIFKNLISCFRLFTFLNRAILTRLPYAKTLLSFWTCLSLVFW